MPRKFFYLKDMTRTFLSVKKIHRIFGSFNCVSINDLPFNELLVIHSNTWNHLTCANNELTFFFKNVINKIYLQIIYCPVNWGSRIHTLHLTRGVRPPPNECPDMTLKNLIVKFQ